LTGVGKTRPEWLLWSSDATFYPPCSAPSRLMNTYTISFTDFVLVSINSLTAVSTASISNTNITVLRWGLCPKQPWRITPALTIDIIRVPHLPVQHEMTVIVPDLSTYSSTQSTLGLIQMLTHKSHVTAQVIVEHPRCSLGTSCAWPAQR